MKRQATTESAQCQSEHRELHLPTEQTKRPRQRDLKPKAFTATGCQQVVDLNDPHKYISRVLRADSHEPLLPSALANQPYLLF